MKKIVHSHYALLLAIVLGVGAGLIQFPVLNTFADTVATLFVNFISMIAAPLLMLAVLSTLMSVRFDQIKQLGRRVFTYTLLTTILSALVALGCFLFFKPVAQTTPLTSLSEPQGAYLNFFIDIVPSNILQALLDNKVISVTFIAFLFGIASHFIEKEHREVLSKGVSALFKLFLKVASIITWVMPVAIFAFTIKLTQSINVSSESTQGLWRYLSSVLSANMIQAFIILPLLLKMKGVSPFKLFAQAKRALLIAFFTKSSNAALPVSLEIAEKEMGIHPKVAKFSIPLCTVINMNGCAAFILTTVLFVAGSHGLTFSPLDLAFWVLMATLAAIGNAGVPMGCFFLSSAFLVSMDVPLATMGLILPFYALIDMEETALNVWSDIGVTAIVNQEAKELLPEEGIA